MLSSIYVFVFSDFSSLCDILVFILSPLNCNLLIHTLLDGSQEVTMGTSGMEATMEDRCMTVVMDMYRTPMTQACTLQQLQLMEPTLFMAISNK